MVEDKKRSSYWLKRRGMARALEPMIKLDYSKEEGLCKHSKREANKIPNKLWVLMAI